jgi:outer membrane protein TolC
MVSGGPEGALPGEDGAIREGEVLTLARCIDIALERQPAIISAMNAVRASRSTIGQAESRYYPQIGLSARYARFNDTSRTGGTAADPGVSWEGDYRVSTSATMTQNIYDFGKTASQVRINRFATESSRRDLDDVSVESVFNVKEAYFGVLKATRDLGVASETVRQLQRHLEQARGLYSVGLKPKFDVTKAEVDVSNASLALMSAENALKIAWTNLDNAMGVPRAPAYEIEDILSYEPYDMAMEEALQGAYEGRPDMQSMVLRRRAAEEGVAFARSGYYPAVSGNAEYGLSGDGSLTDFWSLGAEITFPVFSGFLTRHQVGEARARLDVLKADEELLRQNIYLEVEQAYLNLKVSERLIPTAQLAVRQAEENFEIVNGRYTAGLADPIEVTDAQVTLSNAKTAHTKALFDYRIARANLERAMGIR